MPQGLCQSKITVTALGTEPATFRASSATPQPTVCPIVNNDAL